MAARGAAAAGCTRRVTLLKLLPLLPPTRQGRTLA